MNGQTKSYEPRPYSISEIPKFNIDYRALIAYAKKKHKSVPELSDEEKNKFVKGATWKDVQEARIRVEN